MATTPVGVEFQAKGLAQYLSGLKKADQAQQALGRSASGIGGKFGQAQGQAGSFGRAISGLGSNVASLGSSFSSSVSGVSNFGSALSNVAQIAAGNLLARGIEGAVSAVKSFVAIGADAVGEAQKLEAGLGALLTQNNLYERTTKEVTVAVGNWAETQAEAALKAEDLAFKQDDLRAKIDLQKASIQEQRQRIIQLTAQYGEQGLATIEAAKKLVVMESQAAGMERQLGKLGSEQSKLTGLTQEYTTSTVTSYEQVNTFAEAQRLAAEQTQDLLGFVDKLSIISPFEADQVALVTKFAVGAGLAADEAKTFTVGFLDMAAAVGIGSESLAFASGQLLQVAKIGRIGEVDLRQLRNLGIDLEKIIGVQMGMSIDEFNAKAEKSPEIFNELFNEVAEFSAKTFPGAAQKLASSLGGISSTFKDIFRVGAKNLMRPFIDAVGPGVSEMLGRLSDLVTGPELAKIGANIPKVLFGAFTSLSGGGEGGLFSGLKGLGLDSSTAKAITDITKSIGEMAAGVGRAFEQFGARGAALNLLTQLGITHDAIALFDKFKGLISDIGASISSVLAPALGGLSEGGIIETINRGITLLNENFESLKGALAGIGVVLAAGVLAGIAGGLLTLLAPINLIIAGVALLGAAWAGNWGNIQGITEQALTTITNLFNTYWPIIQAVTLTAWEVLKGIFAGFQTALGPVITQLQTQFTQIGTALAELGITWPKVWDAIVIATGIVAAAIGAIILGIIGIVAGLATGLASGISATIAMFQGLSDNVAGIINGLSTILSGWVMTISALLSGDFAGAWEGFKVVLQGAAIYWTSTFTGMLEVITGVVGIIASTIGGFIQGVIRFFQGMYNELVGNSIIPDMVNAIVAWFKKLPQMALSALSNLTSTVIKPFQDMAKVVKDEVGESFEFMIEEVLPLFVKGFELVTEAVNNFISSIQNAGTKLADMAIPDWIQMHSPPPLATAFNMVADGANNAQQAIAGMQQNLVSSTSNIARFVDQLNIGSFFDQMGLGKGGRKEKRRIIGNAVTANFDILMSGGNPADILNQIQQTAARFNFPPSMATEFAEAQGLVGKLTEKFKAFQQQIAIENLGNLTQATGSLLSLGSIFADTQQQQMGSTEEANKTVEAYKKLGEAVDTDQNKLAKLKEELAVLTTSEGSHQIAIDKKTLAVEKMTESIEFNKRQLAIYEQEIAGMELGTLAWEKKKLQIDKTTESIDAQEQQLVTLQQELEKLSAANNTDTLAIEKKRLEIEKLTQEMAKNQEAVIAARKDFEALATGSAADQIAFLQAFLDSGQESIRLIGEELGGVFAGTGATADVYWTRVDAQEKLNELLEEQRRQEEQIVRQKELQQKFDLLKAQVDLRKQAMDLGIALPAGMKFGLNAGIDGMLKTVNDLTEALINQINSDLQIGSPSKLMIKTFKQVMAGAAIGMERGQSLLSDAVRSIPILNGQIPQPAFSQAGGGGNTYNTYYEMPMTVNTAATSQGVIRQYDIRRSMVAAG